MAQAAGCPAGMGWSGGSQAFVALNAPAVHRIVVTERPTSRAPWRTVEKNTNVYVDDAGGGGENVREKSVGNVAGPVPRSSE